MKISRARGMTCLLLLAAFVFLAVSPAVAQPQERVRVWVSYQSGKKVDTLLTLKAAGAQFHYDFPRLSAYVVTLPVEALGGISRSAFVSGVEVDPERYPVEPIRSTLEGLDRNTLDPNGQIIPWGIDAVQARDVWDANHDAVIDPGAPDGTGIKVCIIDSGYYAAHEDLKDLPDGVTGMSQVDDDWTRDGLGHGSHVAGTISALNNALGVVGVNPGTVSLHIVKIFDDTGAWVTAGHASDLVKAIYSCQDAGAKVISMSLSGASSNTKEQAAFDSLYADGILHVAAAGNHQLDTPGALHYPASYASVISVAALDEALAIADFSAQNAPVELAAPGVDVLSTIPYVDASSITVDSQVYSGFHVEFSARGTASGELVDGGLCIAPGAWSGKVVLCQRGDNSFFEKVTAVQTGGGVAAVIYNNVEGDLFATLGEGNSSTIVAIGITQATGQYLVANKLGQTGEVSSIYTWPTSGYEAWGGTSMATPHVAGVAALVWSADPSLTNVQIRDCLDSTAVDLGAAGRDIAFGYGLVQAKSCLNLLFPTPPNLLYLPLLTQ